MKNQFFILEVRPIRQQFYVFFEQTKGGRLELRSEYRDMACGKCGKFDVLAALKRGIARDVAPPMKRDAIESDDNMLVVSGKAKNSFKSVSHLKAKFFPLPGAPEFFVVYPAHILGPPPDVKKGPVFQPRGRPCQECGRFKQVTYVEERLSVPRNIVLSAFMLECPKHPPLTTWIGSQAVVDTIKSAGLRGWDIIKTRFKENN